MRLAKAFRFVLTATLLGLWAGLCAAEFDNPLAAIAADPQLSDIYDLLKKTGYAEPLGSGGDITFLALSNKLLRETKNGARYSNIELLRDKTPPPAQLLVLQSLTIDGQVTPEQLGEMAASQGSGKATLTSVLGPDAKFFVHRGKEPGSFILEDARHIGLLIGAGNGLTTPNGNVIVIDAYTVVPK